MLNSPPYTHNPSIINLRQWLQPASDGIEIINCYGPGG